MNETLNVLEYFNNVLEQKNNKIINDELSKIKNEFPKIVEQNEIYVNEIKVKKTQLKAIKKAGKLALIFLVISIILFFESILISFLFSPLILSILPIPTIFLIVSIYFFSKKSSLRKKDLKDGTSLEEEIDILVKKAMLELNPILSKINQKLIFNIFQKSFDKIVLLNKIPPIFFDLVDSFLKKEKLSLFDFTPISFYGWDALIFKTISSSFVPHTWTGSIEKTSKNGESSYKTISFTTMVPSFSYKNYLYIKTIGIVEELNFDTSKKGKKTIPLENAKFNKYFNCERNNESQFRMLFSVLAQEEICKLVDAGFNFDIKKTDNTFSLEEKAKKQNKLLKTRKKDDFLVGLEKSIENKKTLFGSLYSWDNFDSSSNISLSPSKIIHYDFSKIEEKFLNFNLESFKNIYFLFSYFSCIPLLQQMSKKNPINENEQECFEPFVLNVINSDFDPSHLKNQSSDTQNIFSIIDKKEIDKGCIYTINAYGFVGVERTKYVDGGNISYIDFKSVNKKNSILFISDKKRFQKEIRINDIENIELKKKIITLYPNFIQGVIREGFLVFQINDIQEIKNEEIENLIEILD